MQTIHIIATTISGSIQDWRKIGKIKAEFEKHYSAGVEVYIVNSHEEAKHKAQLLIRNNERIIVSAGGSGTFAAILEGCRLPEGYPEDLRLAFLRKGSADLLGKVLNIPDQLPEAAKLIVDSIIKDKTITSDVVEVTINDSAHHFIGYGGIGIFGIVPYFTENRLKKYYKGILSSLFGDRGPFLFGINCAILKFYIEKLFSTKRFSIIGDDFSIENINISSMLLMNGDLGKDYPIAKGMPLDSGTIQVSILQDKGIITTYKQLIHTWKGDIENYKEQLGWKSFMTKQLSIKSSNQKAYMVNVDGALYVTNQPISYRISDMIKLITA